MVVGHGKSRALTDRVVKKEAVGHSYYDDFHSSTAAGKADTTASHGDRKETYDDLTLLNWSKSTRRLSPSNSTTVPLFSLFSPKLYLADDFGFFCYFITKRM